MKIVYCIFDCSSPGGTERTLFLQANYFAEKGEEVHIITTEKASQQQSAYYVSDRISFHNLNINYNEVDNHLSPLKIISRIRKGYKHKKKLKELLLAIKPNITIAMFGHESSFLYQINDGSKKILEYHFSRYDRNIEVASAPFLKKQFALFKEWRKCRFINKYNAFVVLTERDAANWKQFKNVVVIPNALPFIPQKSSDCENKKVISVGRLSFEKGYDSLIEAWRIVTSQHPDWELEIYGAGQEYDNLRLLIEKYSLTNITINSPIQNIDEKYIESSIYLMTSHYEGFGIVLIEAMICGLPCISFDCPCGPSEIITNEEDGFLIPANDVSALANKICFLIERNDLRKEMGRKARQNVVRYSTDKIMKKWELLFEYLLN